MILIVCRRGPIQAEGEGEDEAEAEARVEAEVGDEEGVYPLILDGELHERHGLGPGALGLFQFSQRRQHRIAPSGGSGLMRPELH